MSKPTESESGKSDQSDEVAETDSAAVDSDGPEKSSAPSDDNTATDAVESSATETDDAARDSQVEDAVDDAVHEVDTEETGGPSFAATALKYLIFILVIFGLSLWLVPMVSPHVPAGIARHIMPGQQEVSNRLAAISDEVKAETASATAEVDALRAEIAAMTERLAAVEGGVAAAQEEVANAQSVAVEARTAAAESAEAAGIAASSGEAAAQAEAAAQQAADVASTATSAATEAGKVAAAATRDAAALSRRLTTFEAQVSALNTEIDAVRTSLADAASGETGTSPEMAAAFATLKSRVETMSAQLADADKYITLEDANKFATQDDLRSARTALDAEFKTALGALPPAETVATAADVAAVGEKVDAQVAELSGKIDELAETAAGAASSASAAQSAAEEAASTVGGAIVEASLRSATATLETQLQNGVAFGGALAEVEKITGTAPPETLLAYAPTGIATPEALLRGFGRAAQSAISAENAANTEDDPLSRATARFRTVIEGRPKSEQEGADAGAILSRMEARLAEGDAAAALAEATTLSEPAQAALGAWFTTLKARVGADEGLSTYLAEIGASQG